jgi:hypothetical protein
MPHTNLNRKHTRLIEDHFGVRRAVGAFGVAAGRLPRTATAERLPASLSAFHHGSQRLSTRAPRQPISCPTGRATNPSTEPACGVQRAIGILRAIPSKVTRRGRKCSQ